MLFTDSVFVGVDTASGHKAFTYAALDRDLNVVALADAEMEEMAAFLGGQKSAVVAINAPSHVNQGLVKKNLELESLTPHFIRGADLRMAEYDLRERGIAVSGTGSQESLCPAWAQLGFALYKRIARMGFKSFPQEGATHVWLETHPHACFCVLLGGMPLSKPSLEGRLQRALILHERGVKIRDPMVFFEEITRHKLLNGQLPYDLIYTAEELDAVIAAYTAWLAAEKPREVTQVGHKQEGFITLPASVLKSKYS